MLKAYITGTFPSSNGRGDEVGCSLLYVFSQNPVLT